MASSKKPTDVKEKNRNLIRKILEAKHPNLKELQEETKLSTPALLRHLKKMEDDGIIEYRDAGRQPNGRRRFEIILTDKGKRQEEAVRASVAKAYQIVMKAIPPNNPAATTLSDLSELAKNNPKFFNYLGQWIGDYMSLVTGEAARKWIFKGGKSNVDYLQSELTRKMTPLMREKGAHPLNAEDLMEVLQAILNITRDVISKG